MITQRDLYYMQLLANQGRIKYINFQQMGNYAVAEATNGFCYMQVSTENIKPFTSGFFKFTGKGRPIEIELPKGYYIRSGEEKIAVYHHTEPFDIKIGTQGEFKATFNRVQLFDFLKHYLSGYNTDNLKNYILSIHRAEDCWNFRAYIGNKLKQTTKFIPNFNDTISDSTFRLMINPHTLKHILKWFEKPEVTLYFHNGNYEVKSPIFMREDNKLAVIMPIARSK